MVEVEPRKAWLCTLSEGTPMRPDENFLAVRVSQPQQMAYVRTLFCRWLRHLSPCETQIFLGILERTLLAGSSHGFVCYRDLADLCGRTVETVKRNVRSLRDRGLIELQYRPGDWGSTITIAKEWEPKPKGRAKNWGGRPEPDQVLA